MKIPPTAWADSKAGFAEFDHASYSPHAVSTELYEQLAKQGLQTLLGASERTWAPM